MVKKNTLLIDASGTMSTLRDRLNILFHDDVFPDLVFELAMDSWNVKFICDDSDDVIYKIVKDKIYRVLDQTSTQKDETIALIVSCIKDILVDLGMYIYTALPKGISHIQYESMDSFNNIRIKIIYDDFEETINDV